MSHGLLFRLGEVSAIDPVRGTVKVVFEDLENQVSYDLPIYYSMASPSDRVYQMPDIGTQATCFFFEDGEGEGGIIGYPYSDALPPPFSDPAIVGRKFGNGDYMYYNKDTGRAFVKASGGLEIIGDITVTGKIVASDVVISKGISLPDHIHGGVESGGSTTAKPIGGEGK